MIDMPDLDEWDSGDDDDIAPPNLDEGFYEYDDGELEPEHSHAR